jgi:hypothetical protein
MRKCCCCIPILGGATVIGFIAVVVCALEYVVTIPYLAGIDVETFNPLQENLQDMYDVIRYDAEQVPNDTELKKGIMSEVKDYPWRTITSEAVSPGVYFIISLIMICGIHYDIRGLMIPYLVIQMLYIILAIVIGVVITIFVFYFNFIMGIVAAALVLILSSWFIYFWVAVQKAYIELGTQYNSYSLTPIKPTHNSKHHYNQSDCGGAFYLTV